MTEAGIDGDEEEPALAPPAEALLRAYVEEDDAATQLVEPPLSEPRWLVQLTPLDRRAMGTAQLVSELLAERLAPETRVWRDGMPDWAPLEQLIELPVRRRTELPGPDRRGSTHTPRRADPQGLSLWLAPAGVAVIVAAATLAVLSAGGVFEAASDARSDALTAPPHMRSSVWAARPAGAVGAARLVATRADDARPR